MQPNHRHAARIVRVRNEQQECGDAGVEQQVRDEREFAEPSEQPPYAFEYCPRRSDPAN